MAIDLWVREADRELFRGVCDIGLSEYLSCGEETPGNILTGQLKNSGVLSKIRKRFVLGKRGLWVPMDTEPEDGSPFVRIDNNFSYPSGLVLTPYSAVDVEFHLRTKRIDQSTKFGRVELVGSDQDNLVGRAFSTYYGPLVARCMERDGHFVLYSVES